MCFFLCGQHLVYAYDTGVPGLDDSNDYNQIVRIGMRRIDSERVTDSSLLIPQTPSWNNCRPTLIARQAAAMGGREQLLLHYTELLSRAQIVVDFFSSNVGSDDDWPIMILGDSPVAEQMLKDCVSKLQVVVDFLTESC